MVVIYYVHMFDDVILCIFDVIDCVRIFDDVIPSEFHGLLYVSQGLCSYIR